MARRAAVAAAWIAGGLLAGPLARSVRAQDGGGVTVSGAVVDAGSGAPVTAVQVVLVEARRSDASHAGGRFEFRGVRPGRYTVVTQRIGYRPASATLVVGDAAPPPVRLTLTPVALQLAPTVVTGTITARSGDAVLSPTTVVAGAALDRRLRGTLAATLQSQPGVSVATLGPATARPVIRGLGGDRIVILEDGVRPGDLSSTSSDHAVSVDPLSASQLEVVRGPNSLLYGSSALGGVVNVIRGEVPTALPEHAGATLSAEGSSVDDGAGIGGVATGARGRLAYRAEGTARRAGDQRTPLGRLDNTALETYGASLGSAYVGAAGYAGASYRFFDDAYGVPGGFVGGHSQGVRINMRRHSARAEGELRRGAGPFTSVRATAGYTDYTHEEIEASGSLGTRFGQQVAQADVLARHGPKGVVAQGAVGGRYQYRDIQTGGTLRTPSTYDQTAAGFVVEEVGRGRLRLQGGARYDWARYVPYVRGAVVVVNGRAIPALPRTFGSASGSLGALYDVGGGVRLGTSVSRAYRTPDFNELYSNGPHLAAYSYDVGNPSIEQESGVGLDAFARLSRERVRGEVAVFRNAMANYIYPRNTGDIGLQGNRPKFQYTGRDALLTGAEGGVEVAVAPRVVVDGTLSYVRGRFRGPVDSLPPDSAHAVFEARPGSRDLPLMPPLNGQLSVRYDTPRLFGSVGTRFAARQERLGDFETPTAGYGLLTVDAGVRRLVAGRFHTVTLRVDNLLDHAYRSHLSRTKDVLPEAGRNVSLLYRVAF